MVVCGLPPAFTARLTLGRGFDAISIHFERSTFVLVHTQCAVINLFSFLLSLPLSLFLLLRLLLTLALFLPDKEVF